jgi:hypothetical protein
VSFIPDCRDMSLVLSQARDSDWPLGLRARLHLLICDVCRRVRAQFAVLGDVVKKTPDSGPALSADAKARLRQALRD